MSHQTAGIRAAVAGALAAGAAVAAGELSAALIGVTAPVSAVGQAVIRGVPPWLEQWAISVFGTADKVVLLAGVLVVVLLLGAALGLVAAARFGAAVAAVGLLAAAAAGATAADPRTGGWKALVPSLVAMAVGVGVLRWLLALSAAGAPPDVTAVPTRRAKPPAASRRDFLRLGAGVAAGSVIAAWTGRALRTRSAADAARASVRLPPPTRALPPPPHGLEIDGLTPLYVPNEAFYRIDTALSVPRIDPTAWRLRVGGMVDRPLELSYDDLLALPLVEADVTLACVSNEVGGDLVGNARWTGVPLAELLERAGVRLGASQIVGGSVDGWTGGFPTELAVDGRDALVAVAMNGEPLPFEHGFPARLVVPGLFGYVSATKWLSTLDLTTWEQFDGYWVPRGWSKEGPVLTQSRIDVPRANATLAAGRVTVAGVAWDTEHGIEGVEVQVDDGDWRAGVLSDELSASAWRQWRFDWDAAPGEHVLAVRAIDGTGRPQPQTRRPPRPSGATGHHTIDIRVR